MPNRSISYPDLGAVVHLDGPPPGCEEELPRLYRSVFSTAAWFRIFERMEAQGAVVLQEPRHVVFFSIVGDTVEVLNKAFVMDPPDAARVCRALFRALPLARRIHLEVMFQPERLRLPLRVLFWADDMVIDLPATVEEYAASLGKKTRKNLRNFENRLHREVGPVEIAVAAPGDDLQELFDQFLDWHLDSCRRRGIESGYVSKPEQAAQTVALIREHGEVQTTRIDGRLSAIEFLFFIGDEATVYAGSYDPRHRELSLGFLSTYWAICETVRRGARRCHLLWGTDYYKGRLGAEPRRAVRLSVFRSPSARLSSLDEAREVAVRNLRRNGQHQYWRARHAAGRLVRGTQAWVARAGEGE